MSLGTTYSPTSLWQGLQGTNCDLCLHIAMVIGKCTDVFRGIFWFGGEFEVRGTWEDLSEEEFFHGTQDFLALFKNENDEKINMKVFSTESKEQH